MKKICFFEFFLCIAFSHSIISMELLKPSNESKASSPTRQSLLLYDTSRKMLLSEPQSAHAILNQMGTNDKSQLAHKTLDKISTEAFTMLDQAAEQKSGPPLPLGHPAITKNLKEHLARENKRLFTLQQKKESDIQTADAIFMQELEITIARLAIQLNNAVTAYTSNVS